ncbi:LysR family transcriptional regulator [Roseateles noduli]|nr:LysR family transcriptional regulator [Roseateles noduli]
MSQIDRVLRSNLKLRHLQMLVALDQFRHLGRASEFLSQTQPAVSKSLAEVERMFGLDLFTRSTRGTEPTPFGEAVVRFARSVLSDFARTRDEIDAVASGAAGRVSVGAMVVATPGLVAGAVERLKRHSSLTTVHIEEGDLTRLLPRLRVGELDVIVARLEPGYAAPDLATEPLVEEAMRIVVRPDHPLATARKSKRAPWAELARMPWVMPPPWASSRIKLNQMFYSQQLDPPSDIVESASFLVTLTFLRQRGAAAFVADNVARYLAKEGLAKALAIDVPIELPPVGLLTMRNRRASPAAEQFMTCCREVAAAHQPKAASRKLSRASS